MSSKFDQSLTPSLVASNRPPWQTILRLAWPVLVQQFLILFVGLYDQFLAGNNAPKDESQHIAYQAAQTTANYIAWFISSFSALVAVGGTAMVARFVGAGERLNANWAMNQCILLAAILGIVATPISMILLPWGMDMLHLPGESAESAVHFLQPILLLLTCQMIEQAGISCLVGAGDTKTGPLVLSGVALINIPLAWSCFHGFGPIPAQGFFGIGMGTALSHMAGCLAVLVVLYRGRFGLSLKRTLLLPYRNLIGRILRISVPASIDTFSVGLCQLWFLALVNELGKVAATAHGIAIRCEGLGYMSGHAFATAVAALVGQNLGARQPKQAAHITWVALGLGTAIMSVMGLLFYVFAPEMFRFFSPFEHQTPIIEAGVPVLRLVAFAMPPLAAIIILTGALRGAGDTRFPILLTWIGFLLIRIPLAYVLMFPEVNLGSWGSIPGANLGLIGAWIAMFVDLTVRGILFLWRFLGGRWKSIKV